MYLNVRPAGGRVRDLAMDLDIARYDVTLSAYAITDHQSSTHTHVMIFIGYTKVIYTSVSPQFSSLLLVIYSL